MLANGATLGYNETSKDSYTILPGLKEIPEIGVTSERVDNSTLADPFKKSEMGIGELPDMIYKFKYDNSEADSPYRVLRKIEKSREAVFFQETLKDGTKTEFKATVSVKRTGGGVNGIIDFELTVYVQSDLEIVDPV